MIEISKGDWKLFRERIGTWQENYMAHLQDEYIKLLTSPGDASDHFWELDKRIRHDKQSLGVQIELKKSSAIWDIASLLGDKIITLDDLEGFSDDLIEAVKLILKW